MHEKFYREERNDPRMAKKNKTRAELEAENKELRRTKVTSGLTEIFNNLIRYTALVLCVYLGSESIQALAGQTTEANILVKFLGEFNVSQGAAVLFGAAGTMYGLAERRQRQKMIERLHSRIKYLERQIDPKRSSSNLTETGDTNPRDV
jgi:hypothetical protein